MPPTPTPIDWATADWTLIARTLLQSAKTYLPQALEVYTMLGQDQVECPRLVELLDNLANAPHHEGMRTSLWNRRGLPGTEGELWNLRDAYADAVNQFRLDTFRSIRNGCVAGMQPTVEQRQRARDWMDLTGPVGAMEYVIAHLEPVVGV